MSRTLSTLFLISATAIAAVFTWFYYKKKQDKIPDKWKRVGTVAKIINYPLKSGAYKELEEATCTYLGLEEVGNEEIYYFRDRSFVIYESDGKKILNLKNVPKTVLISLQSVNKDELLFQAPNCVKFYLKLSSFIDNSKCVKIDWYGTKIETVDCGDKAAEWFSQYLLSSNTGYRLGYFVDNFLKSPNPIEYLVNESKEFLSVYKNMRQSDGGIYSNLSSYLVVNQASIDDVNSRLPLDDQITCFNMRPNILVSGSEPYTEDNWKWIKINENIILRTFKPCTRCLIITINPEKGVRNEQYQPLKILKSYRTIKQVKGYDLQGDLAVFGINMGLYKTGKIKIGDPVYANI